MAPDMMAALGRVYGSDRVMLKTQAARYQRDMLAFAAKYRTGAGDVLPRPWASELDRRTYRL